MLVLIRWTLFLDGLAPGHQWPFSSLGAGRMCSQGNRSPRSGLFASLNVSPSIVIISLVHAEPPARSRG